MAKLISASTGSQAYLDLVRVLLEEGEPVSPRGQRTFELLDVTVVVEDVTKAHVFNTQRRVNPKIAATEYLHLLAGLSSLEQLDLASGGRFSQFADDGRLMGAYGPRIRHQLPRVVDLLRRDPDTRQAVLTIWNGQEHRDVSRDVPCTLNLQFVCRDGKLHTRVNMRSNDVVLGFPYDIFMFSRLGLSVASSLGLTPGTYTHSVSSMHLYERDLKVASDVESSGVLTEPRVDVPPALTHVGTCQQCCPYPITRLTSAAQHIVLGREADVQRVAGVPWYVDNVPKLTNVVKCASCHYVFKEYEMYLDDPDFCVDCG